MSAFTRFKLSEQLGWINQIDCVVEFNVCLHVSTMLKESVYFKMARTEVIRVAIVMISESVTGEFAWIIKKEEDKKKKASVGEELGHTTSFISSQKTVSFSEPKLFW